MIIKFYTLNDPITNEIRYVGRTKKELSIRLNEHVSSSNSNHNTYKKNWIKLLKTNGLRPLINLIFEKECSWEDSHSIEKDIIKSYFELGYSLVNLNDKGCGHFGIQTSYENKGKPILQYDLNGNFIREWKSLTDAGKNLNINIKLISKCLNKVSHKCKNFQWKFKEYENYPLKIEELSNKLNYGKRKNVIQYSLNGEFIKIHSSATKASIDLNLNQADISNAIKNNSICGKFQWRFFSENYPIKIDKYIPNFKMVKCVSDKEIIIFDSLAQAASKFNVSYVSIRNWCKNNSNKKEYVWFFN